MSKGNKDDPTEANVWLVCPCGYKHKLIPAVGVPVYWCKDELLSLKESDTVEIEEIE